MHCDNWMWFFLFLRFVQLADVAADKFNLFAHIQLEHSHALTCTRTYTHTRELGVVIKPCANGKRTCNQSIWKRFYNDYGRMTRITWWHKDWSQNQLQIDFSVCVDQECCLAQTNFKLCLTRTRVICAKNKKSDGYQGEARKTRGNRLPTFRKVVSFCCCCCFPALPSLFLLMTAKR